jgi:hypothetical protein
MGRLLEAGLAAQSQHCAVVSRLQEDLAGADARVQVFTEAMQQDST